MAEFLNANSGCLSLLAFVLSFPMALLANMATPSIRSWWAQRSNRALRERIARLEARIEKAKRLNTDPSYAIAMFASMLWRTFLDAIFSNSIFIILMAIALPDTMLDSSRSFFSFDLVISPKTLLSLFFFMVGVPINYSLVKATRDLHGMTRSVASHSDWEEETQQEIRRLRQKLSQEALQT